MRCEEIARLEEYTEYSMAAFTEFAVADQDPQGCYRCQALHRPRRLGFQASNGTQGSESNMILARKRKKMHREVVVGKKIRT